MVNCPQCGTSFEPKIHRNGIIQKYCTPSCQVKYSSKIIYYRNRKNPSFLMKERARARKYRERNKEKGVLRQRDYRRKDKIRAKAHRDLSRAVMEKKIIKPEHCQLCGKNKPLDGHHNDYTKPLQIVWVCRLCHRKIHQPT